MKLDTAFTQEIQDWLGTPKNERDVVAGASMLFRLNRNKAFYNTVLRAPAKFADKLDYELRKFLRIRLDGLTVAEVAKMEETVMPEAEKSLESLVMPSPESPGNPVSQKGRREDHESLPPNIKALFDDNLNHLLEVKRLFEELKAMNHLKPCDRYDKLQLLANADRRYRDNLRKYDEYDPDREPEPESGPVLSEIDQKVLKSARKSLSKYRKVFAESEGDAKDAALSKIRNSVDVIMSLGAGFNAETAADLVAMGVLTVMGDDEADEADEADETDEAGE